MSNLPGAGRTLTHRSVALADLRSIATGTGMTIGQVHLAATAGALRRWSPADYAGPGAHGRDVPVCVPVDTRLPGEQETAGSRIGLLRVALPSGRSDPRRRLRKASRRLARKKVASARIGLRAMVEDLSVSHASAALRRLGDRRVVALTVSIFRPLAPLSVLGRPVAEAVAIPWLPPGAGCFTMMSTYGKDATFSVLVDSGVDQAEDLAACWAEEVRELAAVYSSTTKQP